jgi:membrane-associated protease RseP (regulator of RpoE activity)
LKKAKNKHMPAKKEYLVHILLFLLTAVTTLFAGSFISGGNPFQNFRDILMGAGFSSALLTILLLHELAHYSAAKAHKTTTTLPYFIPAPTFIGTFGAVIKIKSQIRNKKALLDIGASGPFASFALSIIAASIGLANSPVVEAMPEEGIRLGDSLVFAFLVRTLKGSIPEEATVMLNPVAFAGWLGFLVTSLNLIPAGQLDGGHVMYAIAGEKHPLIAKIFVTALLGMGFFWSGWFIWAVLLMFLGVNHPPPVDNRTPLDKRRKILAGAALAVFVLTFTPVPIKI